MDNCRYVNVFQGNDERSLPEPSGIAAAWFAIKAQTGNTSPGATLPFGKISAAPFSGGYPTGCGDRLINCSGRPERFEAGQKLLGFSHLQHSGTGAVGYYYNYAVVTPYIGSPRRQTPEGESARPGYYGVSLGGIRCELTVSENYALHRYSFPSDGGKIDVNFANNGLTEGHGRLAPEAGGLTASGDTALAEVTMQGVKLFIAARCYGARASAEGLRATFAPQSRTASAAVAISLRSAERALAALPPREPCFETAAEAAYGAWRRELNKIELDADAEQKEIFCSNLYHSLVKPCLWQDESFIWPDNGPFVTDFVTLWDMYKTQLPLVFTLCPEMSEKIAESLMRTCEKLGRIPNLQAICSDFGHESGQARLLGSYALLAAYRHGVKLDANRLLDAVLRDISNTDTANLSATHTLDMSDGCAYATALARELGRPEEAEKLRPLSELWRTVYAPDGYLTENSAYYEGTRFNYSFRLCADMPGRVALAGGKKRFAEMLDGFFGFGCAPLRQPTDPRDGEFIARGMALGRFEGFNNETDMESPYAYVFAGRHDRACEVVRAGLEYMFARGRGGLPGNNDSGALSSLYVWNTLGLFPIAGSDRVIFGSPTFREAEISLASGAKLAIRTSGCGIYPRHPRFDGKPIEDWLVSLRELMRGGELTAEMTNNPEY